MLNLKRKIKLQTSICITPFGFNHSPLQESDLIQNNSRIVNPNFDNLGNQ